MRLDLFDGGAATVAQCRHRHSRRRRHRHSRRRRQFDALSISTYFISFI